MFVYFFIFFYSHSASLSVSLSTHSLKLSSLCLTFSQNFLKLSPLYFTATDPTRSSTSPPPKLDVTDSPAIPSHRSASNPHRHPSQTRQKKVDIGYLTEKPMELTEPHRHCPPHRSPALWLVIFYFVCDWWLFLLFGLDWWFFFLLWTGGGGGGYGCG